MSNELLFLGTGGSAGVPMIGCHCEVCLSQDAHNKRLRPSVFLNCKGRSILIDAGPDLRFQALRYRLDQIDGVLVTHAHYDHIAGIDELRAYYLLNRTTLPVLLSTATYLELKHRFDYLFRKKTKGQSFSAQLNCQVLENERGTVDFLGLPIGYMTYEQGGMKVNGYRFENLAYVSDIRHYPESIFEDLKGVETLILSALRTEASPMHFTIEEAIEFAKKIQPKQTFFTHIAHEIDHESVSKVLPEGFFLSFDGMRLKF